MIAASRFRCTTLTLLLSWLVPASPGAGQDVREAAFRPAPPADYTPPTDGPGRPRPPPPSLASWADRTWDLLADRSAGDAGAFSRDGLLLRFHEDIDAEYERLSAAGMRFHCAPPRLGDGRVRATYGRDPDGNTLHFMLP